MENLHWLYLQASQTKCVWGYCVINCFEIYRKEKEAYSFWYVGVYGKLQRFPSNGVFIYRDLLKNLRNIQARHCPIFGLRLFGPKKMLIRFQFSFIYQFSF